MRGGARSDAIGVLVLVLILGLVLTVLGFPRFAGAIYAQPARGVVAEAREGRTLSAADLARGVAALERSSGWTGVPASVLSDLALLKLLRVQQERSEAEDAEQRITEALEFQVAGSASAPAGSSGWGRLAYLRYSRDGFTERTRAALEMSLRSSGLNRSLVAFRLQLILSEWDLVGPGLRASARGEIQRLVRHGGPGYEALVDIYLGSPRAAVIDEVLADSEPHGTRFSQYLSRKVGER